MNESIQDFPIAKPTGRVMGFSTILIISLIAGVVLIVGGGLMMYMANLVKSAYEIKVQINSDVESRLTTMGEDLEKKSRWIKRDLIEEIEKIRQGLQSDTARRLDEILQPLFQRIDSLENLIRAERAEWVKAVEADRAAITALDGRVRALALQQQFPPPAKSRPTAALSPDGLNDDTPGDTDEQSTPPAPAKAAAAAPVGDFLQELGTGTGPRRR